MLKNTSKVRNIIHNCFQKAMSRGETKYDIKVTEYYCT
jgi:hypothetical protein